MRIGPIGSNPFIDFYRTNNINRNQDAVKAPKTRDMDYLERQAQNAQTQDLTFEKNLEQAKFDISL